MLSVKDERPCKHCCHGDYERVMAFVHPDSTGELVLNISNVVFILNHLELIHLNVISATLYLC